MKKELYQVCLNEIDKRMQRLQKQMKSYQDAANAETKSSAGDKYETSRAMMQLEKDKIASQLSELQKMQEVVLQINPNKESEKVELGSIVETSVGKFYFSVSLGKLEVDGGTVMAISLASPIGKEMLGKKVGDSFTFNQKNVQITSVT